MSDTTTSLIEQKEIQILMLKFCFAFSIEFFIQLKLCFHHNVKSQHSIQELNSNVHQGGLDLFIKVSWDKI